MADNQSFQSLIESAAGTQALAQSNTPSWVNNGNPNTVYNVTPAEGGYVPPQSSITGDWSINKPRAYAPTNWDALTQDVSKSLIKPTWDISKSVPPPLQAQPQQPAPTTPAPAPAPAPAPTPSQYVAVGNWFGSGKKDGGKSGPLSNQDLVKNNPAAKEAWDRIFMMHNGKFDRTSDWAAVQRDLEQFYKEAVARGVPTSGPNQATATAGGGGNGTDRSQAASQSGGGGGTIMGFGGSGSGIQSAGGGSTGGTKSFGSGGGNYAGASTLYNLAPEVANKLGINPNGTISWQQLADYLIPGDAYLSKSGQWDVSNVVTTILGNITGLPIDSILTKLGQIQAGQDDPQNFIERMLIDHYMDKLNNQLAGKMNMSQAEFQSKIAPLISQAIADSVDISSLDIQNDAVNDLLDKAEKKMQEKLQQNQPATGGGGGGGREGRGGGGRNPGSNLSGVNVQVRSGSGAIRAPKGPGTVIVRDLKTTSSK